MKFKNRRAEYESRRLFVIPKQYFDFKVNDGGGLGKLPYGAFMEIRPKFIFRYKSIKLLKT
jgi:hypothetical protein